MSTDICPSCGHTRTIADEIVGEEHHVTKRCETCGFFTHVRYRGSEPLSFSVIGPHPEKMLQLRREQLKHNLEVKTNE